MNPLIQLKQTTAVFLVVFGLACFVLPARAQEISGSPTPMPAPSPDGGYPGENTAEGFDALLSITSGLNNTAIGWSSLKSITTGGNNTAIGSGALLHDSTGSDNTAIGTNALQHNTNSGNVAVGRNALINDTTGNHNTVVGGSAATGITTGASNTVLGNGAGTSIITGCCNTVLGANAGTHGVTGDGNIIIGYGLNDYGPASYRTYIGNISTTPIGANAASVVVSTLGYLGYYTSSQRYKEDVKPMGQASEAVFALKPVAYRYKKEIDPAQLPAYGLIAEEVAKVNPHLVGRNSQGQPDSVHYDMVNAMLLNEFLKEHSTVQELKKEVAALTETVKEQASQIQKVSAQLEVNKSAPQTVLNNH